MGRYNVIKFRTIDKTEIGEWNYQASNPVPSNSKPEKLNLRDLSELARTMANNDYISQDRIEIISSTLSDRYRRITIGFISIDTFIQNEELSSDELALLAQKYLAYYTGLKEMGRGTSNN